MLNIRTCLNSGLQTRPDVHAPAHTPTSKKGLPVLVMNPNARMLIIFVNLVQKNGNGGIGNWQTHALITLKLLKVLNIGIPDGVNLAILIVVLIKGRHCVPPIRQPPTHLPSVMKVAPVLMSLNPF